MLQPGDSDDVKQAFEKMNLSVSSFEPYSDFLITADRILSVTKLVESRDMRLA